MKAFLQKVLAKLRMWFSYKWVRRWSILLGMLLLLFLLRHPIMRAMARALMHEDELSKVEYCFVLGGNSHERGMEAKKMYDQGYANRFVCTGSNVPSITEAMGKPITEAEVTAFYLTSNGVPDSCVIVVNEATSTKEESEAILSFCRKTQAKKIMLLSSRIHTSRVHATFAETFEEAGIEMIVHGAPSLKFNEMEWWKSEEGLIAVNNEWIKKVYYWFN
jgi:uncharacterized SAM-binding protein YcdF (DUF218 family)